MGSRTYLAAQSESQGCALEQESRAEGSSRDRREGKKSFPILGHEMIAEVFSSHLARLIFLFPKETYL